MSNAKVVLSILAARDDLVNSLERRFEASGFWKFTLEQKREWLMDAFNVPSFALTEADIHKMVDGWLQWEEELHSEADKSV